MKLVAMVLSGIAALALVSGANAQTDLGSAPSEISPSATAPTGSYTEAVVQIVFSDETDSQHPFTVADLDATSSTIDTYFSDLSYGKLDFKIRYIRVHLSTTFSSYSICFRCNFNTLMNDAINAAVALDSTFFDGAKGVSVLILPKYGESNYTWFAFESYSALTHAVAQSLLSEAQPNPIWGGWAHEFGHQLEITGGGFVTGPWYGHPSGYASGYDQMDSCYPCDESGFGLLGAPYVTDPRTVFPGWLDSSHVAVVPIPSGPTGQTFVLPPISQTISTPVIQVVQIPIDGERSYWVNARQRVADDSLQKGGAGIHSEGVQIQYSDTSAQFPVTVCRPFESPTCTNADTDHPNWPYLLWPVGSTFSDAGNGINIEVVSAVSGGYEVSITRDVPPHHPDLYITPWLTPPENTYETVDIWVDSICNGYGVLRYGRRADGTVIGSGDDPCVNHENRVYATIHNIGDADAPATTASFQVSNPLGVGVTGSWTSLGTASVPAIPAGQSASVFVNWTPVPSLTAKEIMAAHFQFHSCVQVAIAPVPGELVKTNNSAQENIQYFEAVATGPATGGKYPLPIVSGAFNLTNSIAGNSQQYSLRAVSRLPAGWTSMVNGGNLTVPLFSGQTTSIPVVITPPPSAVGKIYDLKADALTMLELTNHGSAHPSWFLVGGLDLNAHTVLPSEISVAADIPPQGITAIPTLVHGKLDPTVNGAIVTVDLFDSSTTASLQLTVGADGTFSESVTLGFIPSGVRAIWQGNMMYASAVANGPVSMRQLTSTSLVSSLNPAPAGSKVTFTATVTPVSSGTPTGTVTFMNGSSALGTVKLSGGTAAFSTSSLPVGNLSITAVYSGSESFTPSTSPVFVEVITE